MLQIQWLRRLIRRNTRKIPQERAAFWKRRLSIFYMILSWNAFGGVAYMCFTGRRDWMRASGYVPDVDIPPAMSWAHTLGIKNAQVIKISGFQIDGTYEITEDDHTSYENLMSEHAEKREQEKESVTQSI